MGTVMIRLGWAFQFQHLRAHTQVPWALHMSPVLVAENSPCPVGLCQSSMWRVSKARVKHLKIFFVRYLKMCPEALSSRMYISV